MKISILLLFDQTQNLRNNLGIPPRNTLPIQRRPKLHKQDFQ